MCENKAFLTGYAKLPDGITARELYGVVVVGIVVDRNSSEILDVGVSLATTVAQNFVCDLLIGEKLNDIDKIQNKVRRSYFGSAKRAIITAITICYKNYRMIN